MATITVDEPVEKQEEQVVDTQENDTEKPDDTTEVHTEENNEEIEEESEQSKDTENQQDEKADDTKALEDSLKTTQQSVDEAAQVLQGKGIDYNALTDEYEANGVLSADTYKKLADAGYPKTVVDTFIRGVEAANEGYANAVFAMAGGKEGYSKLSSYIASQGQETVDAFNEAVMNGSLATVRMLVKGFQAEMTLRNGTAKKSVLGSGGGSVGGYADEAAMAKALDDPRYGVDEAYTKSVTKRLSKSKFIQFSR